jgi:hypothetical protein
LQGVTEQLGHNRVNFSLSIGNLSEELSVVCKDADRSRKQVGFSLQSYSSFS